MTTSSDDSETFSSAITGHFNNSGRLHGVSEDPNWQPDLATLQWLLHSTDSERIADAMKTDVPARQISSDDFSAESMWSFAADAAIEAILFPIIEQVSSSQSNKRS